MCTEYKLALSETTAPLFKSYQKFTNILNQKQSETHGDNNT